MPKKLTINPGDKFNEWTVLYEVDRTSHHNRQFMCECSCGTQWVVRMSDMTTNKSKVCRMCSNKEDLLGQSFGRLKVIDYDKDNKRKVICKCKCGNIKSYFKFCLKDGSTRSCGCFQKEVVSKMAKKKKGIKRPDIAGVNSPQFGKYKSDSPAWKPNKLTEIDHLERRYIQLNINGNIRQRQNYCCAKCGTTSFAKHVHHIFSFHRYKRLRQLESNLIMFCVDCHKSFHKKYGNRNNTLHQIEEFLNKSYLYRNELLYYYNLHYH